MKITYTQLFSCINEGTNYLNRPGVKENKLMYALRKFIRIHKGLLDEYNVALEGLKIDLASVDGNKNLIMDGGTYTFTRENQKILSERIVDLNKKTVDVTPHIIRKEDLPGDLSFAFSEVFEGILFDSPTE